MAGTHRRRSPHGRRESGASAAVTGTETGIYLCADGEQWASFDRSPINVGD
jgi:hypothetical protein